MFVPCNQYWKNKKKTKHTPSGYSMFTSCSFDPTKNKLDYYKGEDCTERFCKDLIEHGIKIINCEKNKMTSLTDEENESYEKKKSLLHMQKGI